MSTALQVSLAVYLNTEYEPDCEYVNGVLEDRNVGKKKHSKTQSRICALLSANRNLHGLDVLVEQRVQLSGTKVRIPDVCLAIESKDEVVQQPPALWIEILSPEDRWSRIQRKVADILQFGVETVWIIDPYENEAWTASPQNGAVKAENGVLRCEPLGLEMKLADILPEE